MTTATLTKTKAKPKTTSAVVETTARKLRDLLTPVIPFPDKGDSIPILECIWLRGHGGTMTATATDRYRLGICRERITAPDGFEALLPLVSAKAILATFKPTRDRDPELRLTFDTDTLVVEAGGGLTDAISGARLTYRLSLGDFPPVDQVLAKALKGGIGSAPVGLNAAFLADFRLAVRDGQPATFYGSGDTRGPIGVVIGDHFIGAQMPVRIADEGDIDTLSTWAGIVDLAVAPKASV